MSLVNLTTESVRAAISEYDVLGRDAFLAKYGFRPSLRYLLLHEGKTYDSKAICGAAHGYLSDDSAPLEAMNFSGGVSTVVKTLTRLGFTVTTAGAATGSDEIDLRVFILTWSPTRFALDESELKHRVNTTTEGDVVSERWSTGNRSSGIKPGDHVFLLRQESERGLIAHGYASSEVFQADHWDGSDRQANFVHVDWDAWFATEDRIPVEDLSTTTSETSWNAFYASGVQLPPGDATRVLDVWGQSTDSLLSVHTGDEAVLGLTEGAKKTVQVNVYERNSQARRRCIEHHGATCAACGIDFATAYGGIGEGFIHVHHVTPISQVGGSYSLNPITDLIPVCPNCHAMLHHKVSNPRTLDELRTLIRASQERRRP